jgi:diguanylate cyclase (GGDEF)-like protein
MIIKAYLRIIAKRWFFLHVIFWTTLFATYLWTYKQQWVYESTSSYVIQPRSELVVRDDFVRALDVISRRAEINATFAEVANSKAIKDSAVAKLQLSPAERRGLAVTARVIGGTNVMELMVQGHDPQVVWDFSKAVGTETMSYVSSLYDVFELKLLDEANIPLRPVKPNVVLNLMLGAFIGLSMGIGVIFFLHYLQNVRVAEYFNIIDRDTGAYNKSFFMLRLWQEMSRADRNKYPLSMGLVKIEAKSESDEYARHDVAEAMRRARLLADKYLRVEDILARFDDGTLAVLLPDLSGEKAKSTVEKYLYDIHAIAYDIDSGERFLQIKSSACVISYEGRPARQEQFLTMAIEALESAREASNGEVVLYSKDNHSNNHAKARISKN